jgi:hypothetical protein
MCPPLLDPIEHATRHTARDVLRKCFSVDCVAGVGALPFRDVLLVVPVVELPPALLGHIVPYEHRARPQERFAEARGRRRGNK